MAETKIEWCHYTFCRDGQPPLGSRVELPLVDQKGGDMGEWPDDLCVREFPE